MRRARVLLLSLAVLAVGLPAVAASADPGPTAPASERQDGTAEVVLVHTDSAALTSSTALQDAIEDLGGAVRHEFPRQQTLSVEVPQDASVAGLRAQLAALPGVDTVEKPVARYLSDAPDDPLFGRQRRYFDAVQATTALDRQPGSRAVRVAVLDTGIDVTHPDLRDKVVATYNADTGGRSITDTVGHGTFVAGVAAADTDNGVGVAGAGGDTALLGVKITDSLGEISIDDEIAGIRWATDHGAKIINLSLGGPDFSAGELKAVQYAQGKGVLVVAAAGNEGTATKQYPAAYPGVVAVGATDTARGTRASFSSYGSWVTLAAPGVGIYSTTPIRGSDYFPGFARYAYGDGTSFSAPLVSGAAALLEAENPAMTSSQLRSALVAGVRGYGGKNIGRGQVDFVRTLANAVPTGAPSSVAVTGRSATVTLTAASAAARVAFRIDGDPRLPSVPVVGGRARLDRSSFGYADGPHTVTAYDCSAHGECRTTGTRASFSLDNAAPTLITPGYQQDVVSGRFTATGDGPAGSGARLLVDGRGAAFDGSAPFSFAVNASAYADGEHTLQLQSCSSDHARCAGPSSPARTITFASLHPAITGLSRTRISPNRDGVGDTATVTFTLPERQDVTVETIDARGVVRRRDALGSLGAGRHSWVWRGQAAGGARLPDGSYELAIVTSRVVAGEPRFGADARTGVVDTVAPRLFSVRGLGARVFPVLDGYADYFRPSTALPDGGTLTLTIRSRTGFLVRTLTRTGGATSRAAISWGGRFANGRLVPAGTYFWSFTVRDSAGNSRVSGGHRVLVSAKRLRTRTVTLSRPAAQARGVGGSAPCAGRARSAYRGGLRLVNTCREITNDVAYASYTFRLPRAYAYRGLAVAADGRASRPSELSASFYRVDGGLELPGYARIAPTSGPRIARVGGVPAAGHVARGGLVDVTLILTSRFARDNEIDLRAVRLSLRYVYLG